MLSSDLVSAGGSPVRTGIGRFDTLEQAQQAGFPRANGDRPLTRAVNPIDALVPPCERG